MQLANLAVGGVPPDTGMAWGTSPRKKNHKSAPISCNLRDSKIIFMAFSKAIFLLKIPQKSFRLFIEG